jgi:hypothetical protein
LILRAQALLVSDFGPKISFRIVDTLRDEIRDGKLKSGTEIKVIGSVSHHSVPATMSLVSWSASLIISAGVAETMHP